MDTYRGLDLEGRPMAHAPWGDSRNDNKKERTGFGPRNIPGTVFGEWIEHFERSGGDVDALVGLLNAHAPAGYEVDRESLVDGNREFGPEYYLYFVMFMKKLLRDFAFTCPVPESGLYSRHHRFYERGMAVGQPWGVDELGKPIAGFGILNISFPIRYIESELGKDADELISWMNRFVDDSFSVSRKFLYGEVDTTRCSYGYVLIFLGLAEAFQNGEGFLYEAFYRSISDGAKTLYADYLNTSPRYAIQSIVAMRNALSGVYRDELSWGVLSLTTQTLVEDELFRRIIGPYVHGVLCSGLPIQCGGLLATLEYVFHSPYSIVLAEPKVYDTDHYGFRIAFRPRIQIGRIAPYLCAVATAWLAGFLYYAVGAGAVEAVASMLVVSLAGFFCLRERAARRRAERRLEASGECGKRQISLLKRTNEELLESRANLERRVRERTAELDEANLRLRTQDEAKTRFFENISHELRTPITLIRSPLESIVGGEYGRTIGRDNRVFGIMHRNVLRLTRLVDDIIRVMKVESGNMNLFPEIIDVAKTMGGFLSEFESSARMKGVTMRMVADEGIAAFVSADPRCLETIAFNLLSNALKYTKPGGSVTVEVSVDPGQGSVLTRVRDTGVGIAESQYSLVFERFKRIYDADRNEYGSCGIGLSLSRELARLQGGDIVFESRVGEGSTFTVLLPAVGSGGMSPAVSVRASGEMRDYIKAGDNDEVPVAVSNLIDGIKTASDGKRPRLLVVDDNRDLVGLLTDLLSAEYDIRVAFDGDEALAVLKNGPLPDVVLSDIMMPFVDGIEFLRRIKEDDRLSSVPIVFLTARAAEEERLKVLRDGAVDYIYKPFSSEALKAKLRSVISIREAARREIERRVLSAIRGDERRGDSLTLQERLDQLAFSPREQDVARCLLEGLSDKEIAKSLGLSAKTVSHHASSVYRKAGVSGRMELSRLVSDYDSLRYASVR